MVKAKVDFSNVLERDSDNLKALTHLCELSVASNSLEEAVSYLERIIQIRERSAKPVLGEYKKLVKLYDQVVTVCC